MNEPQRALFPELPKPLAEGVVLGGRYRLIRHIVEGGMGSVWYAEHLTLRSPVAVDGVVSRLTFGGALYVATICIVPSMVAQAFRVPFQFGASSLMIVVSVALETVNQVEAHLLTHSYEGLTGPRVTRLSGRTFA